MEHLWPHPDHLQVPWYASIRVYRGEECYAYQSKLEKHLLGSESCHTYDANVLLQEWYFSLLAKVTACEVDSAGFHSQCMITEQEVLSTERLKSHLVSWTEQVPRVGENSKVNPHLRRLLDACLALSAAKKFYVQYLSRTRCESRELGNGPRENSGRSKIDPVLALSFAVLGESLQYSLKTLRGLFPPNSPKWIFAGLECGWRDDDFLTDKMKADGWSSFDIQRIQLTRDLSALYYAAMTSRLATASEIAKKTSHTAKCGGRCQLEQINPEEVSRVARDGDIPLVVFTAAKTLEMKVYKIGTVMKYTAVSHAWNNFLGSPSPKGLPKCRLEQFQNAVNCLHKSSGPVPFFIECLCVPQQLPAEQEALQRMKTVYEMATNTLVFAPEVLSRKQNTHLFEIATGISNSGWTTRLWTLQEAILSKNLYFQGCDCQFSAKELLTKHATVKETPKDPYHFVQKAGQLMKPAIGSLEATAEHKRNEVAETWKAMQWRDATDPLDETICLAIMLCLPTSKLVDMRFSEVKDDIDRASQMMTLFLDLLDKAKGIPPGFIFLPGEKLASLQYGWAPKTWLTRYQQDHVRLLKSKYPTASYLTSNGLLVQYPGVDIVEPGDSCGQSEFWLKVSATHLEWFRIKYVKDIDGSEAEFQQVLVEKSVSIIMANGKPGDIPEFGVLVERVNERQTCQYHVGTCNTSLQIIRFVKYLCRVQIALEDNLKIIQSLGDSFLKNSQDTWMGNKTDVATHWVVGGSDGERNATGIAQGGR